MFAVVTPKRNCGRDLLFGTDYHSHLGTEFGGIATLDDELVRLIHRISNSQFKTAFYPDMHLIKGHMGLGVISAKDEQPLIINPHVSKIGLFTIATVGFVDNAEELANELINQGIDFSFDNDANGKQSRNCFSCS